MGAPVLSYGVIARNRIITSRQLQTQVDSRWLMLTGCGAGASGGKYSGGAAAGGASAAHVYNLLIPINGGELLTITIGVGGAPITTNQANGVTGNIGTATVISGLPNGQVLTIPGGGQSTSLIYKPNDFAGLIQSTVGDAKPATCVVGNVSTNGYCWIGAGSNNVTGTNGGSFLHNVGGVASSGGCGGGASLYSRGGNGGNSTSGEDAPSYGAGGGGTVTGAASGRGGNGIIEIAELR